MTKGRAVLVGVPAVLLVVCVVAAYLTQGAMANRAFVNGQGQGSGLVDQRPWQTVSAVAPLAVTAEERALALEAERLADHEVDQAFAMALRQAEMEPRKLTPQAQALQQKVDQMVDLVGEDQTKVDGLTEQAKKPNAPQSVSDDLDVAKSQLQLDSDELGDTADDLARASGDKRSDIQQELTNREEAMKKYDAQLSGGEVAVISVKRYGTLAGRVGGWFGQRERAGLLEQAKTDTDTDLAKLIAEQAQIETRSDAIVAKFKGGGASPDATSTSSSRTAMVDRRAHV